MEYLTFHLVFTVPVALVLLGVYLLIRNPGYPAPWGVCLVAMIALVYTTPWDSYMIRQDVWAYGDGVTLARLWEVPAGEYFFFVVQAFVVGFWLYLLLTYVDYETPSSQLWRAVLPVVALGITAGGIVMMLAGGGVFYMGMILVWVGPVLAIQWAYGGHVVARNAGVVLTGFVPATLYLSTADRYAISRGSWELSDAHTTGIEVLGLPVEEGVFFTLTTLLVVQGVLLFRWTLHNWPDWYDAYEARLPEVLRTVHDRHYDDVRERQSGE